MVANLHQKLPRSVCAAALLAALAIFGTAPAFAQEESAVAAYAASEDPPTFDTPEAAAEALKAALAADDFAGTARLLGLDDAKVRSSEGAMDTFAAMREGAARQVVLQELGDRRIVAIGDRLWPLPFPIAKGDDGKWAFDTYSGLQEIVNRHVGENELEAISAVRAYVGA
jgi:Protein of unknown function (DUF2950)